jgi:alpha-beta hydrolase superfamily lysophospholipase
VALHGIQSHSGWYEFSSAKLAAAGFDVRFLDRRGSGLNSRDRGHAAHSLRLVNDVVQVLNDVRHRRDQAAPASPVVLLAVSWGAKLAAALAARRGGLIDALALLYPGICSRVRPTWHQRYRLRLAKAAGILDKRIRAPLDDPALFTSVPDWQRFIAEDPLALHEVTVAFLNASLDLDELAARAPDSIHVPTLVMLAGRDRIIDNAATRKYVDRFASPRHDVIEYPEAAHTLEFEPNRERIFADLVEWLATVRRIDAAEVPRAAHAFPAPPHVDLTGTRPAGVRKEPT